MIATHGEGSRTSFEVTLSVWKALFLREAVHRLFSNRAAWAWLLLEPVAHIAVLVLMFTYIRVRVVGGIDTPVWLMVGMLAFFVFRQTGTQTMNAVGANEALFAYRQVKPVDTVLTRAGLEGFLMVIVSIIVFAGAGLFELAVVPADPLSVFEAFLGLWLFAIGFGLITSVAAELVSESAKIIKLIMTPLYFVSGVIFPINALPPPYREWLMFNPVAHGLEASRLAFAPHYQAAPELSIGYLYFCALVAVFFGLALHVQFASRLIAK